MVFTNGYELSLTVSPFIHLTSRIETTCSFQNSTVVNTLQYVPKQSYM